MNLTERIKNRRAKILQLWLQEVLGSFPRAARSLIASETDRFSNPIGFTLNEGVDDIFSAATGEKTLEEIAISLERLVKFKAVQETRENPLDFLFSLKKVIRNTCAIEAHDTAELEEWFAMEERIDRIALQGLGIYTQAREKILELQVNEMKNKTHSLRKMAGEP